MTSDELTARASDVLKGKLYTGADTDDEAGEGGIPILEGRTITPGTANQTVGKGNYLNGDIIVKGDTNLAEANIKYGKTLFGKTGTCREYKYIYKSVTSGSSTMKFYHGSSQTDYRNYYSLEITDIGFSVQAAIAISNGSGTAVPFAAYTRYMQGICCFDDWEVRLDYNTTDKLILPATLRSSSYAVTLIGY